MRTESFDQGFPLVSSMLIVLGAPCLSEHICINAGPTFSPVFVFPLCCPVLGPDPAHRLNIMLLMEKLIKPSHLVSHLTTLRLKLGSCVSVVHTTASFLQNIIELPTVWNDVLLLLLTWTSNFWCFFEERINQRDWHQRAFHWVPKKREPLKIARLLL